MRAGLVGGSKCRILAFFLRILILSTALSTSAKAGTRLLPSPNEMKVWVERRHKTIPKRHPHSFPHLRELGPRFRGDEWVGQVTASPNPLYDVLSPLSIGSPIKQFGKHFRYYLKAGPG